VRFGMSVKHALSPRRVGLMELIVKVRGLFILVSAEAGFQHRFTNQQTKERNK